MTLQGRYQNRCIADLSWAVSSPPLLLYEGSDCTWFSGSWYRDQYSEIEQQLHALDRDPAILESLLAAQKDRRLGNYFETLWSFALQLNPRYQLIERNLQIHDGESTLGEMDFIVLDNETGRCAHWELAIKFYLGIGDTVNHEAWHGPGKKDRLDLKIDHLLSKQTRLSRHPVVKAQLAERGIVIDDCAVILKGRLFYPRQHGGPEGFPKYANPSHLRGHWLTRQQLMQTCGADARFMPLIRSGWMAEFSKDHAPGGYSIGALMRLVDDGLYRLPLQVAWLGTASEVERLFIVNDDWPQSGA
jgi:hypothetical protein